MATTYYYLSYQYKTVNAKNQETMTPLFYHGAYDDFNKAVKEMDRLKRKYYKNDLVFDLRNQYGKVYI